MGIQFGGSGQMSELLVILADVGLVLQGAIARVASWDSLGNIVNPNRYEFYFGFMAVALGTYIAFQKKEVRRSQAVKQAAEDAGLSEPPSLHPVIDPAKCIGCGACVNACPEGKVIGLINEKAELIEPATCIGHGACKTACPADAISLVFGTATRGIDIPHVSPSFETNVPGLFIAGELGGMGLIANAIEQGRQAVDAIRALDTGVVAGKGAPSRTPNRRPHDHVPDGQPETFQLDLLIVGAGPAGISASLAARQHALRTLTVEQECFGGTVAHYPRGKIVMTRPATLPLHGPIRYRKVRKERLIDLWAKIVNQYRLPISYGERVESVVPWNGGFVVTTSHNRYSARSVLLANGRRGSPRKLGIPGEEQPKVVYKLDDPAQYRGLHVLVVGGGDSALEAAATLAAEPQVHVSLAYRGNAPSRAKPQNRKRVDAAEARGFLRVLRNTAVDAIHPDCVDLDCGGRPFRMPNDAVLVCAGGVLPGAFLKDIGVVVETKFGTA